MTASVMEDPIAISLKNTFQNRSYSPNNGVSNGAQNGVQNGKGLLRGGSSALNNGIGSLDRSLQTASKKTQMTNNVIQFDPPIRSSGKLDALIKSSTSNKAKIIVLNTEHKGLPNGDSSKQNGGKSENEAQPKPKIVFLQRAEVFVGYKDSRPAGAGMQNVGNTCYLNSTLQALFHTPALYNYLISNKHTAKCQSVQNTGLHYNCVLCAMIATLRDTLRCPVIRPSKVYEKLKSICKHLVHGRQEDAHEFLRYLIESLDRCYLLSEKVQLKTLDTASKETTPFNQIFGGCMRQDVTCLMCKHVSTTFQHFMDLLLDIRQSSNVQDALNHYFKQEQIGENTDNMYKCEKCNIKVKAKKRYLIEKPPPVLCIQLKRFSLMGGKISKPVQLLKRIDLTRFINKPTADVQYKLVSMITHVGPSPNCGHYTAIGEAGNGQFFQFDDASVRAISEGQVLNTASYVVFYEMTHPSWEQRARPGTPVQRPTQTPPAPSQSNGTISLNRPRIISEPSSSNGQSAHKPPLFSNSGSSNGQSAPKPPLFSNSASSNGQSAPKPPLFSNSTTSNGHSTPKPPLFSNPPSKIVANKVGVVLDSIKRTFQVSKPVIVASINGQTKPRVEKSLVPYESDSDNENNEKPVEPVKKLHKPAIASNFVPRAITINGFKKTQSEGPQPTLPLTPGETVRKSVSGNWTVTSVEQHNPSIASDSSCGSTTGNWTVLPATPSHDAGKTDRATSPWTVYKLAKKSSDVDTSATKPVLVKPEPDHEPETSVPVIKTEKPSSRTIVREPFVPPTPNGSTRKRGSVDDSDQDDYDAELDRGRAKKVKKLIEAPPCDDKQNYQSQSNRGNPFQHAQSRTYDRRNSDHSSRDRYNDRWKDRHHDQYRSRSNDDRNRRKSFGGNDFRDNHHRKQFGGSHRQHSHNQSFSGYRQNDNSNRNNSYRHKR